MDIQIAKERLKKIEEENFKFKQSIKEEKIISSIPFHQRLQLDTPEMKKKRRDFEKNQEYACFLVMNRYTDINQEDYSLYFSEFLNKFYAGEVKSFIDYMVSEGFKECKNTGVVLDAI